jgi:hypothetical protein
MLEPPLQTKWVLKGRETNLFAGGIILAFEFHCKWIVAIQGGGVLAAQEPSLVQNELGQRE